MALASESAIGNKISQDLRSPHTTLAQPEQLGPEPVDGAMKTLESPLYRSDRRNVVRIEVVLHAFPSQIRHGLYAAERPPSARPLGHTTRFHFHGNRARGIETALFRRGASHVTSEQTCRHGARKCGAAAQRTSAPPPRPSPPRYRPRPVPELRRRRSDADNPVRREDRRTGIHRRGGAFTPHAIRGHQYLVRPQPREPRPIECQTGRTRVHGTP